MMIEIDQGEGRARRRVRAKRLNPWMAIFKTRYGNYDLTHIPTGFYIAVNHDGKLLIQLAKHLLPMTDWATIGESREARRELGKCVDKWMSVNEK